MTILTDKTALTAVDLADLMHVVDVSDTTATPEGTSKKATVADIIGAQFGFGFASANSLVNQDIVSSADTKHFIAFEANKLAGGNISLDANDQDIVFAEVGVYEIRTLVHINLVSTTGSVLWFMGMEVNPGGGFVNATNIIVEQDFPTGQAQEEIHAVPMVPFFFRVTAPDTRVRFYQITNTATQTLRLTTRAASATVPSALASATVTARWIGK